MSKLDIHWEDDYQGETVKVIRKNRGKLNLDEVENALRYDWNHQGNYAMLLRCTEASCGAEYMEEEDKGDTWLLYPVDDYNDCPVCRNLLPPMYCPECGQDLSKLERNGSRVMIQAPCDIGDTVYSIGILEGKPFNEPIIVEALVFNGEGLHVVDKDGTLYKVERDVFTNPEKAKEAMRRLEEAHE